MTLLPVIIRELRAEARRPFTYWLRVVGASALLVMAILFWTQERLKHLRGGEFFAVLHATLFWAIWLVVPVMTADCISREKREGTLGLLFLTPLKALDVVVAKGLAHGLRAAALAAAALPILMIPFLSGGVGWHEAIVSGLINFTSFCWAMSAGILASSSNHQLTRALVLAAIWSFLFFLLFLLLQGAALFAVNLRVLRYGELSLGVALVVFLDAGLRVVFDFDKLWSRGWGMGPPNISGWLSHLALIALASLLGQRLILGIAAWNVRRLWHDRPLSLRQAKLEKEFCTPRFGQRLFRGWMRRLLEHNPVGWLERRTWRSRLVMWGWLAVMIAIYSVALADPLGYARTFTGMQLGMAVLLLTSMAMSAAGSFRRERETGLLELMLVTPLRVGQIVNGRLQALWGQFLPASILFITFWVFITCEFSRFNMAPDEIAEHKVWLWIFCASSLTAPAVGLWCSLHSRLFIVSLIGTITAGFALPFLLTVCLGALLGAPNHLPGEINTAILIALVGALLWAAVRHRRSLRDYAGAFLAPLVAGAAASLSVWTIGHRAKAGNLEDDLPGTLQATVNFITLQIVIAVILLVLLHRALARRQFSLPQ